MTVVNPTVDLIADTIMFNYEDVATCSHRPENVTLLWQDANARYLMAERIAEALGLPDQSTGQVPHDMTPTKLRKIAEWLDTYDRFAAAMIRQLGDRPGSDEALSIIDDDEVQADLRRWAEQLEADPKEQA